MVRITNRFMISSQKFVRSRFGEKGWGTLRDSLPLSTRVLFDQTLNPKGTIEFDHVAELLRGVETHFSEKNPKILFELGLHNSEEDLSATQKVLMKLISVEWVLRIAAYLWKQRVIEGGTIEIDKVAANRIRARVIGFGQPIPQWWSYLSGWFTTAIQFSGGKNVKVEWVKGGKSQYDAAEYDASWS